MQTRQSERTYYLGYFIMIIIIVIGNNNKLYSNSRAYCKKNCIEKSNFKAI